MTELKPTSGKAWRERVEGGVIIRLSSSLVVRLRPVHYSVVFKSGKLPDALTPLIAELMEGKPEAAERAFSADMWEQSEEMVRVVCESACMEPRIVNDPTEDDEIGWEHLDEPDRREIFACLGIGLGTLQKFRDKQKDDVGDLVSTEGHAEASE
jgi:hypothetical protein